MTTSPTSPTLEPFFERLRRTNPFMVDRVVQSALASEVNAAAVHERQLRQLLELACAARDLHLGLGVVLWGQAGVGKSHLLSRLASWAAGAGQACYVPLQNLQPSPENLPRSLLRATVSILTQGRLERFHDTSLFRLMSAALQTALQTSTLPEPERAYAQLLNRLSEQTPSMPALVDRTIYNVFFAFLNSAAAAQVETDDGIAGLAVRWLSGDPLDLEEAGQLGLPPQPTRDDGVTLADDQQIKLVLVALSQLALFAGQPLLLCFDQVENVEPAQISALTRFLQALLDSAPNLLVVTCGIYDTLNHWHREGVIHDAAWDRIAQHEIPLPRVTALEARQIIETRLEHFLTPLLEVDAVRKLVHENHLFPLGTDWFKENLQDKIDICPRQAIRWARDGWARSQQALAAWGNDRWLKDWRKASLFPVDPKTKTLLELIDEKVEAKLAEQKTLRQLDRETLPPDADNLAGLTDSLLRQCLKDTGKYSLQQVQLQKSASSKQRPTYHLTMEQGSNGRVISQGVLFLTTGKGTTSAACALRRLVEDRKPPQQLLLVTEERRPLQLGAKGQEYVKQVRRNYGDRFRELQLTFDQYAELDALKSTGGMALSKDLEVDLADGGIHSVTEAEVIASHHRHERYGNHVLLRPLLGLATTLPKTTRNQEQDSKQDEQDMQDACEFIMSRLALMPGVTSRELTVQYIEYRKNVKRSLVEPEVAKALIESAAHALHKAGHGQVTPHGDDLFLLPRRKQPS